MEVSRRALLAGGAAAFLAACAPRAREQAGVKQEERGVRGFGEGWKMRSSVVGGTGETISRDGIGGQWYGVTVPCTVLAGLVANGEYPELLEGENLLKVPRERFRHSWWYRKEFATPTGDERARGTRTWLHFLGINYRANVWVNGRLVADSDAVVGAYRDAELDITSFLNRDGKPNVLAVEVFPPNKNTDLAITFVDWAPEPPDLNMGIWQEVELRRTGAVRVRYPYVDADLDVGTLASARLTVRAQVVNGTDAAVTAVVSAEIEGIRVEQTVRLGAREEREVVFSPEAYPALVLKKPRVWWPWQLGKAEMYSARVAATVGGNESDAEEVAFGVRKVTSRLQEGSCLFTVNGVDLLILGGGYAPDLLQRRSFPNRPTWQEDQVRYARGMNLNTIRLEGKLEDDAFYALCDRYGMLVMAGWCCCSPWEKWKTWKAEQHAVAEASLRYQMRRARTHPSMLVWLNGSDNHPPADVEATYLAIEKELGWPCPTLSSAAAKKAASGETGVKMEGPYKWEPPVYWLTDKTKGGAHGFNTEVGPGAVPPPVESLERMVGEGHLWPMDRVWAFHCGGGTFGKIDDFTEALDARFGKARGVRDFAWKSQLQAYETIRAMYEGFRRNKFNSGGTATGEIQWMLNNAWPSLIWHLYDYYLRPGAAYFATKLACEPVHVLYSYDNGEIVVGNETLRPAEGMTVVAEVFDIEGKKRGEQRGRVDVPANRSVGVFTLEVPGDISRTYFVRLTLADGAGRRVSTNSYFLSTVPDVLSTKGNAKDDWNITRCVSYADYTALERLPAARVTVSSPRVRHYGSEEEVRVRVKNEGGVVAVMVRLKGMRGGEEILPVRWEDNYFLMLPGEEREVGARYLVGDVGGGEMGVEVECFNDGRG